MNLRDFKISLRLGAGFGMVLTLMLIMITVSLGRFTSLAGDNEKFARDDLGTMASAHTIAEAAREDARRTLELFILSDRNARVDGYAKIDADRKEIDDALMSLNKSETGAEGRAIISRLQSARTRYSGSFMRVAELIEAGSRDEAAALMTKETLPALDALLGEIKALTEYTRKNVDVGSAETKSSIASSQIMISVLGIIAMLGGIGFAIWITRTITEPLNQAVEVARHVAKGDLTTRIDTVSADETGQLLQALKEMNESLARTVGEVRIGTEMISSVSGEIAAGNSNLSSRTESQASSLQETSSSMEELTATVRQNADNARQANRLVLSASDVAMKGGEVVGHVVETMNSIKDSSSKIVDIIGVIDSIAFQTNILALNAAVEAARAGEQGRGFAVVAAEVRSLAQRSAGAAKEIKALIDASVERVDAGARLVDDAGATMEEIVSSVKHVADIMSEITAASDEQSTGIEQVHRAISHMDEITQQNAALVEQAAAAAQSMQDQAQALAQAVQVFRLAQGAGQNLAAPRKPAAQPMKAVRTQAASKSSSRPAPAQRPQPTAAAMRAGTGSDDWEEF